MEIAIWIGLGLIAGGAVSLMYDDSFVATLRNITFGLVGSIIGGGIMTTWDNGRLPTLEFYLYSILFTVVVSLALIGIARLRSAIASQNFTPLAIHENTKNSAVVSNEVVKKEEEESVDLYQPQSTSVPTTQILT